jgi:hypothetical protein
MAGDKHAKDQDLNHPQVYDFNCYLDGVKDTRWDEFLFGFGHKGYSNTKHNDPIDQVVALKPDIRRVKSFYNPTNSRLDGLQMWDREGKLIYESSRKGAFTTSYYKSVETVLEEGERIVGIKSY